MILAWDSGLAQRYCDIIGCCGDVVVGQPEAAVRIGVDVRALANVGGRVTAAVTLSLILLLAISIGLVRWFG